MGRVRRSAYADRPRRILTLTPAGRLRVSDYARRTAGSDNDDVDARDCIQRSAGACDQAPNRTAHWPEVVESRARSTSRASVGGTLTLTADVPCCR